MSLLSQYHIFESYKTNIYREHKPQKIRHFVSTFLCKHLLDPFAWPQERRQDSVRPCFFGVKFYNYVNQTSHNTLSLRGLTRD